MKNVRFSTFFRELVWSEIDGLEFYDANGLQQNITKVRGQVAKNNNGDTILITKGLLDAEWTYKPKFKTFVEAYNSANGNPYLNGLYPISIGVTISAMPAQSNLSTFSEITLKSLVEDKLWVSWDGLLTHNYGVEKNSPYNPENLAEDFQDALKKLVEATSQYYLLQHNSNRKLKLTGAGLIDTATNQVVEVEPSLWIEGRWYRGDIIEPEGEEIMDLTTAVAKVDWETENIVYAKGTTKELIIDKNGYENWQMKTSTRHLRYTEPIYAFVIGANWNIVNKETGEIVIK